MIPDTLGGPIESGINRVPERFNEAYYRRFYTNPKTRVSDDDEMRALVTFVSAYITYMGLDIESVLDMGCGPGRWKPLLEDHFPDMRYTGVEVSEHMVEKYGWIHGSVNSFEPDERFDLIICHDVFQYLTREEARDGIARFGEWCEGVLYFAALTTGDWEDNVDQAFTDSEDVHLRSVKWYRRQLEKYFIPVGGSLFVHRDADVVLFELEQL